MAGFSKAGKRWSYWRILERWMHRASSRGPWTLVNPLSSFIPAIDSNTANATKYMKNTRIAGVFMQSLSHSVNKTSEVPGSYKCPIEKLSELRHFHRHTILSNQLTVPPNFIAFYVKLACGILLVKDTWRRGVQVGAGKGGRKGGFGTSSLLYQVFANFSTRCHRAWSIIGLAILASLASAERKMDWLQTFLKWASFIRLMINVGVRLFWKRVNILASRVTF